MNYFTDTNYLIASIFSLDNLNEAVLNFNQPEYHYFYSENVEREVEDIFKNKSRQYQSYLMKLDNKINSFSDIDLINVDDMHHLIDGFRPVGNFKINEMHAAFNKIWLNQGFDETHDAFEVKSFFNIFKKDFQSKHMSKKNELFSEMTFVSSHTKKDKRIIDKIKKENLKEYLHDNDEDILFDANEYCQNNPWLNLKFVSADRDFIKAIKVLGDELCINECINLLEFSPNN